MPTIVPDPGTEQETARRLLAQADDPSGVGTDTQGVGVAFIVSDALAAKAGFEVTEEAEPDGEVQEPPRSGRGSGEDAWRAFLAAQDPPVEAPDDATRDDLIAAWDNRK